MALATYGKIKKVTRNENVEIHVREVVLLPNTNNESEYIEIREFIKSGEVYGNGIVIPRDDTLPAVLDAIANITGWKVSA